MYSDIRSAMLRPDRRRCIVGFAARNMRHATRGTHYPAAFAHICIRFSPSPANLSFCIIVFPAAT
jgi:hypothetical protein